MRLDDLLRVMCDEFARAADDIDLRLMQWLGEGGAQAADHAQAIAADLDRTAQTARMISLEGLAVALEHVRNSALALALLDEDTMGQGLGWLAAWRAPFEASFASPGNTDTTNTLCEWLAEGPMPLDVEACAELRAMLAVAPVLPRDAEAEGQALPDASDADVSLALPEDVDADLYETFLADAPAQVARLGDAVRALVRGELNAAQIQEAQRVAHTFKGSGHIVGVVGVGRLAHRIEDLIEFAAELASAQRGLLPPPIAADLEQATATLDQMLYSLRGEEAAPLDARAHLQALVDWVNAIRAGTWEALASERGAKLPFMAPATQPRAVPALPAKTVEATAETPDAEAQLRVGVSHLDRLVRRAGQGLVHGGRIGEHLRNVEDRLQALEANNGALHQRLRELQVALERQGVTLQEKVLSEGAGFDPLELDRYDQLHTLSRFVAELVADELELTRTARTEAGRATAALREHGQALKDQHRELLSARLVPFRNITSRLRRTVAQTAAALGRKVRIVVVGEQVQLDSDVLERLTEPLLHLLRNAVDHGIEPADERVLLGKPEEGTIHLSCQRDGQTVRVECRDDGRGLDLPAVHAKAVALGLVDIAAEPSAADLARLILLPGFSTRDAVTEVSGRGVGMDVVAERVRAMKGHVDIHTEPLAGSTFALRVPATSGTVHALVVEAGGELMALPADAVVMALAAGQGEHEAGSFTYQGKVHHSARLAGWVGLPEAQEGAVDESAKPVVVVHGAAGTVALGVDRVVEARELILQDVGSLLRRARGVTGGALRTDGRVIFVLDTERLDASTGRTVGQATAAALQRRAQTQRKRVLVVDDAISVRKAVSQLVQDAGYEVFTARDGFDALQQLETQRVDIVLTDLEMPNLNGLDFTRRLRQQPAMQSLPVVMITSRSTDKHRAAAELAGVNLYLTKPYTDDDLLAHVRRLLVS